jgi:hypothetical protein
MVAVVSLMASCGVSRQSCTTTTQCPAGEVCSKGACYASTVFGDSGTGGSGNTGGGTSSGGGNGGGSGALPPCQNLQCQQTTCAKTYTGCTVPACTGETLVTGVVYEPAGKLPLYNAVVYVPNSTPDNFTDGASCESCGASVTGSPLTITLTDSAGGFKLKNVPVGTNIPLVIQIGHWRRQVTIPTVTACGKTELTDPNVTRLPRSKIEGSIPQMAIATGSADPFECLLLKMGIDQLEFTPATAGGRVHYFVNNGLQLTGGGTSAGTALYDSLDTLKKYDVVFLPCEGAENRKSGGETKNLVDYTRAGGRAFVTHYGYVWTAYGSAPFPSTANWSPDPKQNNNPPDPVTVTVNQTFPKGADFATWLGNVGAATNGQMSLAQSRDDVGLTLSATTAWMKGANGGSTYNWTPHLTFNMPYNPPNLADGGPGQVCGRVVFSDFHVTTDAANTHKQFPAACTGGDYTAQEKALVFMLFDLSACVQSDTTAPTVCSSISQSCTSDADCCNGLLCLTATGAACSELPNGCTCNSAIN